MGDSVNNKKFLKVSLIALAAVLTIAAVVLAVIFMPKDHQPQPQPQSSAPVVNNNSSDTQSTVSKDEEPAPQRQELVITSPEKTDITTTSSTVLLAGTSDPQIPLTVNGEELEREADGSFSVTQELTAGNNNFEFSYGEEKYSYVVRYKYVLVQSYSPDKKQSLESGSTLAVSVNARAGSTVTATFNGKTINLEREIKQSDEISDSEFVDFLGSFKLPSGSIEDKTLGTVNFVVAFNGLSNKYSSGVITCKKDPKVNYIAEIVAFAAETFDGKTADDNSNPKNNYLPKGTVDYCDTGIVYYKKGTKEERSYYNLRCGRRVYIEKEDAPAENDVVVTKRYIGTLPDHNEISVNSVSNGTRHTVISFSTLWKAPFLLDLLPQKYTNEAKQDFTLTTTTYEYVEITFCYATKFEGSIVFENNKIFKSASVKSQNGNTVLRLYLKGKGKFYGWDCEYDKDGNLVFIFLNPVTITETDANPYGVDLSNAKILIDVGHGGKDIGALARVPENHNEGERNLYLALMVVEELRKTGANIVMTRSTDTTVTSDTRCQMIKKEKADYCLSIHHNAVTNPKANGFGSYYCTPFSAAGATFVNDRTLEADIYGKCRKISWHYFYCARMSTCPVVLTENGFITNYEDSLTIESEEDNRQKAIAIVKGIVDYFKYIQ